MEVEQLETHLLGPSDVAGIIACWRRTRVMEVGTGGLYSSRSVKAMRWPAGLLVFVVSAMSLFLLLGVIE